MKDNTNSWKFNIHYFLNLNISLCALEVLNYLEGDIILKYEIQNKLECNKNIIQTVFSLDYKKKSKNRKSPD